MSIKAAINSLLIISIAAYGLPVLAQQAAVFKDSSGTVFLYGVQPNSTVTVDVTKPKQHAAIANSCGVLLVRSSETFSTDGQTIDPNSNLTIKDLPKTCGELAGYPATFRTGSGALAITGKTPQQAYTISLPNHKTTRRLVSNDCGFVKLSESTASTLNLPTITGGRADFSPANFLQAKPLLCVKSVLYISAGFNLKTAVANASGSSNTGGTSSGGGSSSVRSGSVSSQTAQPSAVKNIAANKLIISSVPPGTYVVRNGSNPALSKSYTVTGSSSCFVVERSQLSNPSNFIVSRQGLTFPVNWSTVPEVSVIPSC